MKVRKRRRLDKSFTLEYFVLRLLSQFGDIKFSVSLSYQFLISQSCDFYFAIYSCQNGIIPVLLTVR